MADEINNVSTENQEAQKKSAGCIGLGFSLLFPIIGIMLYFTRKSEKFDASGYLYAAGAGIVFSLILRLVTGTMR